MPYSGPMDSKLPDYVKKLSPANRRRWVRIFNRTFAACMNSGGDTDTCESRAFKIANGVVLKNKR